MVLRIGKADIGEHIAAADVVAGVFVHRSSPRAIRAAIPCLSPHGEEARDARRLEPCGRGIGRRGTGAADARDEARQG